MIRSILPLFRSIQSTVCGDDSCIDPPRLPIYFLSRARCEIIGKLLYDKKKGAPFCEQILEKIRYREWVTYDDIGGWHS
jgi:hypothetical protein